MTSELKKVLRFDISEVGKLSKTAEGYLRGDAVITRTGVFSYRLPSGTVRRELRHPDDVFNSDAISSLKNIPITNNHPITQKVTVDNAKEVSIGFTGENVRQDGGHVIAPLNITTKDGIEAVNNGKTQLSVGYDVILVEQSGVYNGERYDARQTDIVGNHIALCNNGRAGNIASFNLDSVDAVQIEEDFYKNETGEKMSETKLSTIQLDDINYQAEKEVVNAFKKHEQLVTKKDAAIKDMQVKLDSLQGEKDALGQKVEELLTRDLKADIADAVKTRVTLLDQVKGLFADEKLDDLSDMDIKKKVITKLATKEINLDSMSEDYVNARFDTILELSIDHVKIDNIVKMDAVKQKKEDEFNLDELRDNYNSIIENRYKTVGGK